MLACIIFSLFAASPPTVDPNAAAVTQVWSYVGELIFNMLVLLSAGFPCCQIIFISTRVSRAENKKSAKQRNGAI